MKRETLIITALLASLFLAGWIYSLGPDGSAPPEEAQSPPPGARPALLPKDPGRQILDRAVTELEEGRREDARALLYALLERHPKSAAVVSAQDILGRLNWTDLLSPRPDGNSLLHLVERGDSLEAIARKYGTTIELIREANEIEGNLIQVGQRIHVPAHPFEVVAIPSEGQLHVRTEGRLFKAYPAGFARIDFRNRNPVRTVTDPGTGTSEEVQEPLRINARTLNPAMKEGGETIAPGSPRNYLGSAVLNIDQSPLKIHGRLPGEPLEPFTGPGCIRMRNRDIKELYLILPRGTPVTFID